MTLNATAKLKHIPELDGLRGLAAMMVIGVHLKTDGFFDALNLPTKLGYALDIGQTGVDLFFVLSGFLITRILISTKGNEGYFRKFYARRSLRIFPLYYLALCLAYFVLPPFYGETTPPASEQWWFWAYLQNIPNTFHAFSASGPYHFWSLAVEEHFYLAWPALVFLCPRKNLPFLSVSLVAFAVICRITMLALGYSVYFLTPCRVDALAMGTLLAAIEPTLSSRPYLGKRVAAWSGGVFLALVVVWPFVSGTNGPVLQALKYTAIAFVYFGLIAFLSVYGEARASRVFRSRPMVFIGTISYGLYVYHPFCFHMVQGQFLGQTVVANSMFAIALTFFVASISYFMFENPILRLKRYVSYSQSTMTTAGLVQST